VKVRSFRRGYSWPGAPAARSTDFWHSTQSTWPVTCRPSRYCARAKTTCGSGNVMRQPRACTAPRPPTWPGGWSYQHQPVRLGDQVCKATAIDWRGLGFSAVTQCQVGRTRKAPDAGYRGPFALIQCGYRVTSPTDYLYRGACPSARRTRPAYRVRPPRVWSRYGACPQEISEST
jgi:hypothetical protein